MSRSFGYASASYSNYRSLIADKLVNREYTIRQGTADEQKMYLAPIKERHFAPELPEPVRKSSHYTSGLLTDQETMMAQLHHLKKNMERDEKELKALGDSLYSKNLQQSSSPYNYVASECGEQYFSPTSLPGYRVYRRSGKVKRESQLDLMTKHAKK